MVRFFQIFTGLLIVLFVAIVIAWHSFPRWLSRQLTEKAGVPVTIQNISLTPWTITVDKFKIYNPPRSGLTYAFTTDKTVVDAPLTEFLKKDIQIPEMTLNNIYLGVVLRSMKSKRGNWDTITKNFERNTSPEDSERTVNIKRLVLNNFQIDVLFQDEGRVRRLKPIRQLVFKNVGSKGGLPIQQITKIILNEIKGDIIQKKMQQMLQDFLSPGGNPLRGLFLNPDPEYTPEHA